MVRLAAIGLALALSGCGVLGTRETPPAELPPAAEPPTPPAARPGAYYKDDGPGDRAPADLAAVPEAVPAPEPLHRYANRPYQVFGRDYAPFTSLRPFRQQGTASWYGRRFHGSSTSSGEPYDMYAMSAAHPILPIPSYARVTNLANGRSVIVRVNDRGPFHAGRVIDLSYAAAVKLGFAEAGSAPVEVEAIVPEGPALAAAPATGARRAATPAAAAAAAAPQGVYLQLGAFAGPENAESFRARIARELASLAETIQVFAAGGLFRLQLGPYRSPREAQSVAERIEALLSLRPLLVVR
jgi:rare lipoprotein A